MQIQMQAFSRKTDSLRRRITHDLAAGKHEQLYVQEFKSVDRSPGWAKILGHGLPGALNIEWDANSHMLLARAISKQGNTPHKLLGVFLDYLIERHGKRIASINIQLR